MQKSCAKPMFAGPSRLAASIRITAPSIVSIRRQAYRLEVPFRLAASRNINSIYDVNQKELFLDTSSDLISRVLSDEDVEGPISKDLTLDEGDAHMNDDAPQAARARKFAEDQQTFKIGDVMEVVVASVKHYMVYVDLGNGNFSCLLKEDICNARIADANNVLCKGDKLKVVVRKFDAKRKEMLLSTKMLEPTGTADLQDFKSGDVVEAVVQIVRPYGVLLDLGNDNFGWLLKDQISQECIISVDQVLNKGDKLKVMVLGMNQRSSILKLSTKELEPSPGDMLRNRQLVYDKAEATGEWLKKMPKVGDVVEGVVRSVQKYGAFMDLGIGYTGLLHASEISRIRLTNLEAIIHVGDRFEVKVLDNDRGRLKLTTKQLGPTVGEMLRDRLLLLEKAPCMYKKGDVVEGVVQSVQKYGAYIGFGNDTSGLLHISQISRDRVITVDGIFSVGDKVKAMVFTVVDGRISLSTKQLEPSPGAMLTDREMVFENAEEMAQQFMESRS